MFNHEIFAVSLARSLELVATGAPRGEQKEALRAVHALTSVASAMVRVHQGLLSVDDVGIPDALPFVPGLIARMQAHGVAEIAIAMGANPVELLALVRGLAGEPPAEGGVQRIKMRLRDAHSADIMVIALHDSADAGHRPPTVTQAFEAGAIEQAAAPGAAPGTPAAASGAAPAAPDGAPPDALRALELTFELAEDLPTAEVSAARQGAAAPAPAARAEPLQPSVLSATTPLAVALERVARDPYGPGILDRLTGLSQRVQEALAGDAVQPALHAIVAMAAWEPGAPEGTPKNSYAIVLRRTLTRDVLVQVAPYVADPRLATEAVKVMQRGRADGAEVLLDLLAGAEDIRSRKSFMIALREMPEGVAKVVHMLGHHQWFVVRNVAELMGELKIEEAVPDLARCLGHGDARVRRAAAVALAKIGTAATAEPLRHVLKGGDAELRALAAASIGGPGSQALAMPLVALAEGEADPNVLREYYHALGRIGSPEAVKALVAAAGSGGGLLRRRPAAPRVAAIEGLRMAGGRAAIAALEALTNDGEKAVREAAAKAAGQLKTLSARTA
jgi:HEAT repeat protein